jgi:hypothetical protein
VYDGVAAPNAVWRVPDGSVADIIAVSPDNQHTFVDTYNTTDGKSAVFIDGVQSPSDRLNRVPGIVVFSKGHSAYIAGNGRFSVVVDGKVSKQQFYSIPSLPIFSQDGRYVTYGTFDGHTFSRVTEKVADIGKSPDSSTPVK